MGLNDVDDDDAEIILQEYSHFSLAPSHAWMRMMMSDSEWTRARRVWGDEFMKKYFSTFPSYVDFDSHLLC